MAILGNAAGAQAHALGRYFPPAEGVRRIRIDDKLHSAWAANGSDSPGTHACEGSFTRTRGRPCVVLTSATTWIMVDAYRQPCIPPLIFTDARVLRGLVRDHLRRGAHVVVNAGHPEGQDEPREGAGGHNPGDLAGPPSGPTRTPNTLILGQSGAAAAGATAPRGAAGCRPTCGHDLARGTVAPPARALQGGAVYTDNKAPSRSG